MQVKYAPGEPRIFRLQEEPRDPQFELHARIKMAQGLGSVVYNCVFLLASLYKQLIEKVAAK